MFLVAALLAAFVRVAVVQAYRVDGPSMEPTLRTDERVVALRCSYGLSLPGLVDTLVSWSGPQIGDVVIFSNRTDDLVKRVMGLEGDVIEIKSDMVYRNGQSFDAGAVTSCPRERYTQLEAGCITARESFGERSWRVTRSVVDPAENVPALRVPKGFVYVMGDHRGRSTDSRRFGPVPMSQLRGRVIW